MAGEEAGAAGHLRAGSGTGANPASLAGPSPVSMCRLREDGVYRMPVFLAAEEKHCPAESSDEAHWSQPRIVLGSLTPRAIGRRTSTGLPW